MKIGNQKWKYLWGSLLVLAALVLVFTYICQTGWSFYNSDCADSLFWAQASYEAKSLFNKDFIYACTLPFGGQWFFLPFIGLFGMTVKTQILGMCLFLLVFSLSLFFFLKVFGLTLPQSLSALAGILMVLSLSDKLREIFWGHVLYYSCAVLGIQIFLLLFILYEKYRKAQRTKVQWLLLSLLCIWTLLVSANGASVLSISVLPLLVGIAGERFLDERPFSWQEERPFLLLMGALVLSLLAGYWLHGRLTAGYTADYEDGYMIYTAISNWEGNQLRLLPYWVQLLGFTPSGEDILSLSGLSLLIKLCAGIAFILIPILLLVFYKKVSDRMSRIYILMHWTLTGILLFGWLYGELASAGWRLSPLVYSSCIMTIIFLRLSFQQLKKLQWKRVGVLLLLGIFLTGLTAAGDLCTLPRDYRQVNHLYAVADFLESQDLSYGYSTFWEANALTVISDSQVKARGIRIEGAGYTIEPYQTSLIWYEDQPGIQQYFVLLKTSHYYEMLENGNILTESAISIHQVEDFTILIFDKNIF
ncbi:MAG: hypothetical protein HFI30_12440 [Lachnospiraceae bacterium]|jgi:hypothetical protein|nr:hypothetical protein [Lachnospiraceae bacterium]